MAECPEPTSSGTSGTNIMSGLLVKIEDLVNCQSVEGQRLEFKASWNKGPTMFQVVKIICAFANDLYNVNGGYIVIGVAESEGDESVQAIVLPPVGINPNAIERIRLEILDACINLIRPPYSPELSVQDVQGKLVLVICAKRSHNRPHRARESKNGGYEYYIRKGPMTTKANDNEIKSLHENSSKIPFDNRMAEPESGKRIPRDAIDYQLVRTFLDDVNSQLERGKVENVLQKLRLVVTYGDALIDGDIKPVFTPKNVALLMFNHFPHLYFPGAKIEVTQMTRDNDVISGSEKVFTGPLPRQIKKCVDYVHSTTNNIYPREALQEAIVNALYHRRYEPEYREPTIVLIRPDCLEIISYPGPHSNLKQEQFISGSNIPPVPTRNKRIGEILKDLRLAESRWTGVQKIFRTMERNGNPTPKFVFNSDYFSVILPALTFQAKILVKDVEEIEVCGSQSEAGGNQSEASGSLSEGSGNRSEASGNQWETRGNQSEASGNQFQSTQSQLQSTRSQLQSTRSQLQSTQNELRLPVQEQSYDEENWVFDVHIL